MTTGAIPPLRATDDRYSGAVTVLDLRRVPKVLLHDHLDGGLRPQTVIELAAEAGHVLPVTEPEALAAWFESAASSGSLPRYLDTFEHTIAALQTAQALERVAYEAVADLAEDAVVYAELRWAPEQHLRDGLTLQQAVDAVQRGLHRGASDAAARGQTVQVRQILTALRQADRWEEIARLAVANRDAGVVGFDLAGAEAGHPADRFPQTWRFLADEAFPVTIHAGEAAGVQSIAEAVHRGHAVRLGHGVRLVEDIAWVDGRAVLGRTARWVQDQQIALELCPSSNVQTGASASIAAHGITMLRDLDFAITVNTDNRLMSGTSLTRELTLLVEQAGWTGEDVLDAMLAAAWSAFLPHGERRALARDIITGFAAADVVPDAGVEL